MRVWIAVSASPWSFVERPKRYVLVHKQNSNTWFGNETILLRGDPEDSIYCYVARDGGEPLFLAECSVAGTIDP